MLFSKFLRLILLVKAKLVQAHKKNKDVKDNFLPKDTRIKTKNFVLMWVIPKKG